MKKIMLSAILATISFCALADNQCSETSELNDYKHYKVKLNQSMELSFDFQPNSVYTYGSKKGCTSRYSSTAYYANNIWLNITGEDLTSSSEVRVVLLDGENANGTSPVYTKEVDLYYEDGKFTAPADNFRFRYLSTSVVEFEYDLKIAIVVDGQWYPGGSNYSLDLSSVQ